MRIIFDRTFTWDIAELFFGMPSATNQEPFHTCGKPKMVECSWKPIILRKIQTSEYHRRMTIARQPAWDSPFQRHMPRACLPHFSIHPTPFASAFHLGYWTHIAPPSSFGASKYSQVELLLRTAPRSSQPRRSALNARRDHGMNRQDVWVAMITAACTG